MSISKSNNGALTNVAATTATGGVRLLTANQLRQGATITNESTAILYLVLGNNTAPSSTSYSVYMAGGTAAGYGYYELPFNFVGEVWGIWSSATGTARVTELT